MVFRHQILSNKTHYHMFRTFFQYLINFKYSIKMNTFKHVFVGAFRFIDDMHKSGLDYEMFTESKTY